MNPAASLRRAPVRRPVNAVVPRQKLFETGKVVRHIPIGWCNNRGRPAHNMVAAEQRVFLTQRVAKMVGCVARGVHASQGETVAGDAVRIAQHDIGHKFPVRSLLHCSLRLNRMRTKSADRRAGPLLQESCCRRMITMRVSDQNVAEARPVQSAPEGFQVPRIIRSRINDCNVAVTNKGRVRAAKCERPGIGRQQPAYQRTDCDGAAIRCLKLAVQ